MRAEKQTADCAELVKTSFMIQSFMVFICSQTFIEGSLFMSCTAVVNYLHLRSDFPKIIAGFLGT